MIPAIALMLASYMIVKLLYAAATFDRQFSRPPIGHLLKVLTGAAILAILFGLFTVLDTASSVRLP